MRKKTVIALVLIIIFSLFTPLSYGHEVPDLAEGGTITVRFEHRNLPVNGGDVSVFYVGEICEEDGDYFYRATGDFRKSGVDITNIQSPAMIEKLEKYIKANRIQGIKVPVTDGKAIYTVPHGKAGLYLVMQEKGCSGYENINTFAIGLPSYEEGAYSYDVDASPKMEELVPLPDSGEDLSTAPGGNSKLPQTGQLNWPVPVLAAMGLLFFSAGWLMKKTGEDRADEE